MKFSEIIAVRGGGDLATGVAQKFHRAGFPVVILEKAAPAAIRRGVSLCEAAYDGFAQVEDVLCRKVSCVNELNSCWSDGTVPLLIDPAGDTISSLQPACVIDAILAKINLGTRMDMADVTIGLGPGFCAGTEVHAVIETMRGHNLGRLILNGRASPDTGIPGDIDGKSAERVIYSPTAGILECRKKIGDMVERGDIIFTAGGEEARAPFSGLLRGILRNGAEVIKGTKTADIDPRADADWRTVSDKARCIGGAALEAYLYLRGRTLRPRG